MDIKKELIRVANELSVIASGEWMSVDQIREICSSCADKMEAKKMTHIKKAAFITAAETWEECIEQAKNKQL